MSKKTKSPYKVRNSHRETYCTTLNKVFKYTTTVYWDRTMAQFVDGGQKYTHSSFKEKCNMLSTRLSTRYPTAPKSATSSSSSVPPSWALYRRSKLCAAYNCGAVCIIISVSHGGNPRVTFLVRRCAGYAGGNDAVADGVQFFVGRLA